MEKLFSFLAQVPVTTRCYGDSGLSPLQAAPEISAAAITPLKISSPLLEARRIGFLQFPICDGSQRMMLGNATRIAITNRCAMKCGNVPRKTSATGRLA